MNLYDLIDESDLQRGIEDKLINVRYADDGQRIYNYSDRAMFTDGAWDNPAVRTCRGLIVDENDEIVARPWSKFFNHGQVEAGELDLNSPVEVTNKADGSLGVTHLDSSGHLRVATRGSFVSDQAIWATEFANKNLTFLNDLKDLLKKYTFLVEIIYPDNRIVLDYGDFEGLVLLGAVEIETGRYLGPDEAAILSKWSGQTTEVFTYSTLAEALEAPPRPNAEGLCVRYLNESRIVKIKQEDYVALHKIVTGLNEKAVWEHMLAGGELEELLEPLPDELHDWTREVWEELREEVAQMFREVQYRYSIVMTGLDNQDTDFRKNFAMKAKKFPPFASYLFMQLDGKDVVHAILKNCRRTGEVRAKALSEDVA